MAKGLQFLDKGERKEVSDCLGGRQAYVEALSGVPKVYLRRMMQLDSNLWMKEHRKRYTTRAGEWDALEYKLMFSHWEKRVRGAGGSSVMEQEKDASKETKPLIFPFVQAERNKVRV